MVSPNNVPDGFWERVQRAPHRLLALDYDGTLAPFQVDRMAAEPLVGIPELLLRLTDLPGTTTALVSGRPIDELVALVGELPVTMAGSHGWEVRRPDGSRRRLTPEEIQVRGLDQAESEGKALGHVLRMERKVAGVAVHTRPLSPAEARAAEETLTAAWSDIAGRHRLECRGFNGGVEIRAAGHDKGTILSMLIAESPADTLPVYVGDDETDEDAFRRIAGVGFGFKVGDPDRPTAAAGRLADEAAVRVFLTEWIDKTS